MPTDNQCDAIVIGLGGLTTGSLLSHAGLRVLVLEKNETFGGSAMAYHKGAMMIEASLHETTDPRTRVREMGMRRFKSPRQAQRFLSIHAAVYNRYNLSRHLASAIHYRLLRQGALLSWRQAAAV
jgi:putative transposase